MEQLNLKVSANSASTLPTTRESSNVRRVLSDRMLLSEAIEAVGHMIRGYGHTAQAGKSYVGAIAELLMQYPRSVAMACADPRTGVASTTRFLPTPGDIVPWCEKACRPLHEEGTREHRIDEQLRAREEWNAKARSSRVANLISYDTFLQLVAEGKTKPRPIGRFEVEKA